MSKGRWRVQSVVPPALSERTLAVCGYLSAFGWLRSADVIAAWSVFSHAGRRTFRDALDVDGGTWNRARGFALHQAAMIIPYYTATNPRFVAMAKRTVEEVLADINA